MVLLLSTTFSSRRYKPPGNRPKATPLSTCTLQVCSGPLLTSGEQRQRDYGPKLGFKALEERRQGEDVEQHMQKVEMHYGEEVETVHCANSNVSSGCHIEVSRMHRPFPELPKEFNSCLRR